MRGVWIVSSASGQSCKFFFFFLHNIYTVVKNQELREAEGLGGFGAVFHLTPLPPSLVPGVSPHLSSIVFAAQDFCFKGPDARKPWWHHRYIIILCDYRKPVQRRWGHYATVFTGLSSVKLVVKPSNTLRVCVWVSERVCVGFWRISSSRTEIRWNCLPLEMSRHTWISD